MIFKDPSKFTKLEIWYPRYSSKYTNWQERVVLLAQYKVQHATEWILVEFSKAKHLKGQRFCIKRRDVMQCPIEPNGSIPCYAVRMSQLEGWSTHVEVIETIEDLFNEEQLSLL